MIKLGSVVARFLLKLTYSVCMASSAAISDRSWMFSINKLAHTKRVQESCVLLFQCATALLFACNVTACHVLETLFHGPLIGVKDCWSGII